MKIFNRSIFLGRYMVTWDNCNRISQRWTTLFGFTPNACFITNTEKSSTTINGKLFESFSRICWSLFTKKSWTCMSKIKKKIFILLSMVFIRDQQLNIYDDLNLFQQQNQRNISLNQLYDIKIGEKLIIMVTNLIVIRIQMVMSKQKAKTIFQ